MRTSRQLRIEADAQLDERRELTVESNQALVLPIDASENLEKRALSTSVRPDDPEELAAHHGEADISQRLLTLVRRFLQGMEEVLLECRPLQMRKAKALRDVDDFDYR
jgi:hypothetical protein